MVEGISRATRRALDELRTEFAADPTAIRARAVELVCEVADAPIGLWYRFGLIDDEPYPVEWVCLGTSDRLVSSQAEQEIPWPSGDPRLPDPMWSRRFLTMGSILSVEQLQKSRLWRTCYEPARLGDQVRMMIYHRGRHVGWIGAFRQIDDRGFGRAEVRRLRTIAAPLADALVHADAVADAHFAEEGCDLVINEHGRIELASTHAHPLLMHPEHREMLRSFADAAGRGLAPPRVLAGQRVRWARLSGDRGVRYLLHLEPLFSVTLHSAHVLSRTQRKIAAFAAAGAHIREIAQNMEISEATVRTHMRHVYAALAVSNRAELARTLQAMPQRIGPADPVVGEVVA